MRGIGIKIEVIQGENAMLVNRHFRSLIPCLEKWVHLCRESYLESVLIRLKVEFPKNSFRVCVRETEAETDFQTVVRAH